MSIDIEKHINSSADDLIELIRLLKKDTYSIANASAMINFCLKSGNKILIAGNGGSASQADHLAAEIVGRFLKKRKGYPAFSLSANSSVVTSVANDFTYEEVFSRQVEALAEKNDLVIGISTSGNSRNIYRALVSAKERSCSTIAITGFDGGQLKDLTDCHINVSSKSVPRIQESHLMIIHLLCELFEEDFK